jgi:hypothetical protein
MGGYVVCIRIVLLFLQVEYVSANFVLDRESVLLGLHLDKKKEGFNIEIGDLRSRDEFYARQWEPARYRHTIRVSNTPQSAL